MFLSFDHEQGYKVVIYLYVSIISCLLTVYMRKSLQDSDVSKVMDALMLH